MRADEVEILPFRQEKLAKLNAHLSRHWLELDSNRGHFLPYDIRRGETPLGVDLTACERQTDEVGWQRWFLVKMDHQVQGHYSLKGSSFRSALYRCELSMGLEVTIRHQGIGTIVLEHAINYARSIANLEWIDLNVMGHNVVARSLYEKIGFETVGVIRDRFRIQGESLDDVMMCLRL